MTTAAQEARTTPDLPRVGGARGSWYRFSAAMERWRVRLFGLDADGGADRRTATAYTLAALALVLYPLHQLLTRGELLLSGAMWAEMATNYYAVSIEPSLLDRLFATDAGYIPLPQRLIALVGAELGVTPDAVAHLYTGAALLLGAALIATICLPVFRPVIRSDGIRFVLALALILVPDYETRTFINVTYFAVVPAVAVTALAAVQRERQVPAWAWVLPLFMLSKPGVLAVLPAMVLVALVSRSRFRRITVAALVAGTVQVVQLAVSSTSGSSLLQQSDQSALSKMIAALKYTVGFIGRLLVGPGTTLSPLPWMFLGLVFVLVSLAAVVVLRSRAAPLVPIGFSLVLFTMMVNAFTFSAVFTRDMAMLSYPAFDRRFVVAVFGALFVMAGLVSMVVDSPRWSSIVGRLQRFDLVRAASVLGTAALAAWLLAAGWLQYSSMINRSFGVPVADVSQWQQMSPVLSSDEPVVCVPLNPFSWVYGRECTVLASNGVPFYYEWTEPDPDAEASALEVTVPVEVTDGRLASVGLLVRPRAGTSTVTARAVVTDGADEETVLDSEAELPAGGGLMQFVELPTPLIEDARTITFFFEDDVEVALWDVDDPDTAVVLWMGQAGGV